MSPFTHTWPVSTSCRYGKRGREDTEIISVESSVTSISYAFSREINYSSPRKYELSLRNPAPIHPRSFFFSLPSDSPGLRRRILFCQFFFPCFIAESYRPIAPVWYSGDRYCLPRNSTPDRSPRVTPRWRGKRMKRAHVVVRNPSRTATALHGLLIFISCNIYRGAIAVRRGGKSRGFRERLRDIRW